MIVDLIGGLGNQMFQYAFGVSLAKARNEEVFFSVRLFGNRSNHIRYMMDVYRDDLKLRDVGDVIPQYTEKSFSFDPGVYVARPDSVFTGYWQTEKYFDKDLVREKLNQPKGSPGHMNAAWAHKLSAENSTFIQVRRGDYLNPGTREYHGLMPLEYYMDAASFVKYRQPDTKFYVFSDDPHWCRANFPLDFQIIDENTWQNKTAQWDIWLMSKCRNGIIANSSFGWWSAWLGNELQDRIVVAPKKWFNKANVDERDIVPEKWTRL